MKWTRPVMNKTAEQHMNVADIKRLVGNIEYVHYALLAGASIPTPGGVAAMVTKLIDVGTSSIISKSDFDWIRESTDYFITKYNSLREDKLESPIFSCVDNVYMNALETIYQKYKVNLLAGWGF